MATQPTQDELALFQQAFEAIQGKGNLPFPWQVQLFQRFCRGDLPSALDLPTGLGKTSVMAIWLLARAFTQEPSQNRIPRRLVYVVDRRAVVDQATAEAEKLRTWLDGTDQGGKVRERLGFGGSSLPISTLRGQHIDNREWLADPAMPAIIVSTVDMIGSRLLFSGYGVSSRMRPYHAGLLGADTLVVLDEAHLVPPFERLLSSVASVLDQDFPEGGASRPKNDLWLNEVVGRGTIPQVRLMSLSATGRTDETKSSKSFRLGPDDLEHPVVAKRLNALKRVKVESPVAASELSKAVAERAWQRGADGRRVIVFCNSRKAAEAAYDDLANRLAKKPKEAGGDGWSKLSDVIELIVGARRVFERKKLARATIFRRFSPQTAAEAQEKYGRFPGFLVCTSAGEVGVDLDADYMVCDLVPWERMVQRFGRVNRLGNFEEGSCIDVFPVTSDNDKAAEIEIDAERIALWRAPFESERWPADDEDRRDASPGALLRLRDDEAFRSLAGAATTPAPLRPALTRALVDAWSMTSLKEHTGRPDIQPWLRGWVEDKPQASIIWRTHLPARVAKSEIDAFFEAAPPHTSEMLETETWRIADWLIGRAVTMLKNESAADAGTSPIGQHPALLLLDRKNELAGEPWTLGHLAWLDRKENRRERESFSRSLAGHTLVVWSVLGGLTEEGMLDEKSDTEPTTIENEQAWQPAPPFRVLETDQPAPRIDREWRESYRLAIDRNEDGDETRWIVVEQRRNQPQSEDGRAIAQRKQQLAEHHEKVAKAADKIAGDLNLPQPYRRMLEWVARHHDSGKNRDLWQNAMGAPREGRPYAKTVGGNGRRLNGYRHEFGTLRDVETNGALAELDKLGDGLRDLALHLIAAHHGQARPLITAYDPDEPPSALEGRAREVALRFARLQKRWGPWGLAWWEALFRAADQQASRDNDTSEDKNGGRPEAGEVA
jgi:CRISPR-associated endonuclease/helicase Cas3